MKIAILILLLLGALLLLSWVLMIRPGKKHPHTDKIKKYIYAHRGLHSLDEAAPENSMAAFCRAIDRGYGIELDLHLTKDKELAVIHDTSLLRTAGKDVDITDLDSSRLKDCLLEKTDQHIPLFGRVLSLVSGRVPLLVELKVDNDNYAELCERTVAALGKYNGLYAIQSFDPRALIYLKKHYPNIMRGQLAGFLRKNGDTLNPFLDFGLRNLLSDFLTRPNFIAYRVQDSRRISVSLCRILYKPLEFNWTLRKKKHHRMAKKHNAIPIFEDYIPV